MSAQRCKVIATCTSAASASCILQASPRRGGAGGLSDLMLAWKPLRPPLHYRNPPVNQGRSAVVQRATFPPRTMHFAGCLALTGRPSFCHILCMDEAGKHFSGSASASGDAPGQVGLGCLANEARIAYFSMEIALHPAMPACCLSHCSTNRPKEPATRASRTKTSKKFAGIACLLHTRRSPPAMIGSPLTSSIVCWAAPRLPR